MTRQAFICDANGVADGARALLLAEEKSALRNGPTPRARSVGIAMVLERV